MKENSVALTDPSTVWMENWLDIQPEETIYAGAQPFYYAEEEHGLPLSSPLVF